VRYNACMLTPIRTLGPTSWRHAGTLASLAASHDGVWVAGGSVDLTLWRASDGEGRRFDTRNPRHLCFCRDDSAVAAAGDTFDVWSTLDGRRLLREGWRVLALAPDGERGFLAAVAEDGYTRVRRVPSGEEVLAVEGKAAAAALSDDGSRLAVAPSGGKGLILVFPLSGGPLVRIAGPETYTWETTSWAPWGEEVASIRTSDTYLSALAFSPDGRRLASGGVETVVRVWDVARGALLHERALEEPHVLVVAWAPDGGTVGVARGPSDGKHGPVALWTPETGDVEIVGPGRAVAFRGEVVLYGGHDHRVRLRGSDEDGAAPMGLGVSLEAGVVVAWTGAALEARSLETGERIWRHPVHHPPGYAPFAIAADGSGWTPKGVDADPGFAVRRFWTATGPTAELLGPTPILTWSLDLSPEGELLAIAGNGEEVAIWDLRLRRIVARLYAPDPHVVRFTADGVCWVARKDGALCSYRVAPSETPIAPTRVLLPSSPASPCPPNDRADRLAISADGTRAVSSWNDVVRVWDLVEGRDTHASPARDRLDDVLAVGFGPEGEPWGLVRRTVAAEDGERSEVSWWSPWRGFVPVASSPTRYWVGAACGLPDGVFLLSGDDGVLRLYGSGRT
jgi:WD40 repeat protein